MRQFGIKVCYTLQLIPDKEVRKKGSLKLKKYICFKMLQLIVQKS
jgi:hypothetical protein